jgi:VWFA-related protein
MFLALGAVVASAGLLPAQLAPVYQVVVDLDPVAIDVAVTDSRGRAVTGLSGEDFVVYEDGQRQAIRDVEPAGMPYNILLLVDRSARDQNSPWPELLLESVDLFLKNLRGPDRLAVASFDDRVAVLVDWRPSRNGNAQNVMLRKSEQHTRFFDAVEWASEEMELVKSGSLQLAAGNGRNGVIVFTDGRDFDMYPRYLRDGELAIPDPLYEVPAAVNQRFEKSRRILQQRKVPFYFVAIDTDRQSSERAAGAKFPGWVRFLKEVRTRVEDLADVTGGSVVYPKRIDDLLPLYNRIQRDLGTGYHITYHSKRPPDGKLRQVEIRIRNRNLAVYQSNNTYYPR